MMGSVENRGLIVRGLEDFFKKRDEATTGTRMELGVSFLEIYNEKIRDLFVRDEFKKLRVKIGMRKGVYVQGLAIKAVSSYEQAKLLIDRAYTNRTVSSTKMNDTSSRSHCIFTMYITKICLNNMGKPTSATEAKVDLIDLAGSENARKSMTAGASLMETNSIHQSLAALGNIIFALSKGNQFIPYRSSVLTLLLRNGLGGNSKTLMLCAISPADENISETWATLRCASRVKGIVNMIKKKTNEKPITVTTRLKGNIEALKTMINKSTMKLPKDEKREEIYL